MATASGNRAQGRAFEEFILKRARFNGMFVTRNELTAKYIPGRRVRVVKSELDFRFITREGKIGYFDAKSYNRSKFKYSDIDPHQIQRAATYAQWNVPSGFIVWFMKCDSIAFYTARRLTLSGPGSSFGPEDGIGLGSLSEFDLKPIMSVSNEALSILA